MRKLIFACFTALLAALPALAEQSEVPAFGSIERFFWAKDFIGPMPDLLTVSLAAIVVLSVVSIIWYRKAEKDDEP